MQEEKSMKLLNVIKRPNSAKPVIIPSLNVKVEWYGQCLNPEATIFIDKGELCEYLF